MKTKLVHSPSFTQYVKRLLRLSALTATLLAASAVDSTAATVTLTASDTGTTQSFTGSSNWDNGQAPSAGNDYRTGVYTLRTDGGSANYTFAGDSLTMGDSVTTNSDARLAIRTTGTVTISDLRLNHGNVAVYVSTSSTLAGSVTLIDWGSFSPTAAGRTLIVTATVGGSGQLRVSTGNVILNHANNSYTGGTIVAASSAESHLFVQADGALGSGDVSLKGGSNGTKLTLSNGITNSYIASTASLILAKDLQSESVTLSFQGVNVIGNLSFDGGLTWVTAGTYGAIGSGATYQSDIFSGTGLLEVTGIPEASTSAMLGIGALIGALVIRQSVKKSKAGEESGRIGL